MRATHVSGAWSSASLGSSSGASQTTLNPAMPSWATAAATNLWPSRYWAILASMPSRRRSMRSRGERRSPRSSKRRRMVLTEDTTEESTPSITTFACPSSRDITAVSRDRRSRSSSSWIAPSRPGVGRAGAASCASCPSRVPVRPASASRPSGFAAASAERRRSGRDSALSNRPTVSAVISARRCSRSQGAAANCTRWVCSCRHTQRRKSAGSTLISARTCATFGATSSRRPPGGPPAVPPGPGSAMNGSY